MAITNNILMMGLRGTLGKQITFRMVGNKSIVSAYPDMSNVKASAAQMKVRSRMTDANVYAKKIMSVQKRRNAALLRLKVLDKDLKNALVSEYFRKFCGDRTTKTLSN